MFSRNSNDLAELLEERDRLFEDEKQLFFEYLMATDTRDLEEIKRIQPLMKEYTLKSELLEAHIQIQLGKSS